MQLRHRSVLLYPRYQVSEVQRSNIQDDNLPITDYATMGNTKKEVKLKSYRLKYIIIGRLITKKYGHSFIYKKDKKRFGSPAQF